MKKVSNILNKLLRSKLFWVGILVCAVTFIFGIAESYAAYECPTMAELRERYQSKCFACQIVKVLIASFMRAASMVYDVSRDAGIKLLIIGSLLWTAFWALKKLSSLTSQEPMTMMNELVIMMFKVLVAYVFITAGSKALVGYAVNPILGAGADFGTALIVESEKLTTNGQPSAENAYNGPTDIVSADLMNKILHFSEGVSNQVANNLVIGNALTCFSIKNGIHWNLIIEIHIPDIWLWLCGAAIWVVGLLLTITVCYYLIDIPFKLGFAIIALPVVIGLWPFGLTKDKFKDCIQIIFHAAATFIFLALATSYAMVLMDQSLGNIDNLEEAFDKDNVTYVENLFDITGPYFLIILFCYIYGFQLIGDLTKKLPDKFVGGTMVGGSSTSPMHHTATAATMWLGNKAMAPVKLATDIAAHQGGKLATGIAAGAGNVAAAGGRSVAAGAMKAFKSTKLGGAVVGSKIGQKIGMDKWDDKLMEQPKKLWNRVSNAAVASAKEVGDAVGEVAEAVADDGSRADEKLEKSFEKLAATQEKILTRAGETAAAGMEFVAENAEGIQNTKEIYSKMKEVPQEVAARTSQNAMETAAAAVDTAQNVVEGGIDIKNTAATFAAKGAHSLRHIPGVGAAAGFIGGGIIGGGIATVRSAVKTGIAAKDTLGGAIRTVASPIRATGGVVNQVGKTIDNAFKVGDDALYTTAKGIQTGLTAVSIVGRFAEVGYRSMAATKPGKAVGKAVNVTGKSLKVGGKIVMVFAKTLDATRGPATRGKKDDDIDLSKSKFFEERNARKAANQQKNKEFEKPKQEKEKNQPEEEKINQEEKVDKDLDREKQAEKEAEQNRKAEQQKRAEERKKEFKEQSEKTEKALQELENRQKELEEAQKTSAENEPEKKKQQEEAEYQLLQQQEETRRTCVQFKEEVERSAKAIDERIKAIEEMPLEERAKHENEKYALSEKRKGLSQDLKMLDEVLDMVAKGTKAEKVYQVYKGL